jgi:hypothetical protein
VSVFEVYEGLTWLYGKLSAASSITALVGTRIYPDETPEEPTTPYITISLQAPKDRYAAGRSALTAHVMTDGLYLIQAWDRAKTYDTVAPIAAALDAVLSQARGATTGGAYVADCRREVPVLMTEREGADVQWRRAGGLYLLTIHAP